MAVEAVIWATACAGRGSIRASGVAIEGGNGGRRRGDEPLMEAAKWHAPTYPRRREDPTYVRPKDCAFPTGSSGGRG